MTNLLLITNSIVFRPFSWEVIIAFVVILLLLVVSGLISASEVAYFSLSPNNLNTIDSDEHNKYDTVKELRNKPEDLLATILITNNFVNVAIIILSTYCLQRLFDFSTAKVWGFIIETVIITFILLMFGEIMPKIYAKQHALKTVVFMAKTIKRLHRFLKPMVNILVGSTKFVNKRMAKHQTNNLSMDELQQALELTTGTIDGEKQILKGIATFGELNVEAIMTSRLDMVMLEMSTPYRQDRKSVV